MKLPLAVVEVEQQASDLRILKRLAQIFETIFRLIENEPIPPALEHKSEMGINGVN